MFVPRPHVAQAAALALGMLLVLGPACGAKKKQAPLVTLRSAQETYELAMEQMGRAHFRKALSMLQGIQYSGEEREELEPKVRLAIADATYYQRYAVALIDARSLYTDFATLYTDHRGAPYALFQAGMCSMAQMRSPSKDQSDTLQAIADLEEVRRRYPGSTFAAAARSIIRQAETRLAEHEFQVGRYYLKRRKPLAAADRFRQALERSPHHPEKDKLYFFLGQALLAANNEVEARIYLDKLVRDYPHGPYVEQARKELARAGGQLELDFPGSP